MQRLTYYIAIIMFLHCGFYFSQKPIVHNGIIFDYQPLYHNIKVTTEDGSVVLVPLNLQSINPAEFGRNFQTSTLFFDDVTGKVIFIEWMAQRDNTIGVQGIVFNVDERGGLERDRLIESQSIDLPLSTGMASHLQYQYAKLKDRFSKSTKNGGIKKMNAKSFKSMLQNEGISEKVANEIYNWLQVKRLQR